MSSSLKNFYLKYYDDEDQVHYILIENAIYNLEDLILLEDEFERPIQYTKYRTSTSQSEVIQKVLDPPPISIKLPVKEEDILARILRMYRRRGSSPPQLQFSKNPKQLKDGFLNLIKLLNKSKDFTYWADRETLLGTFRHKGLIPWNPKTRLGILLSDLPKLRSILAGNPRYFLIDNMQMYHLVPLNKEIMPQGTIKVLDSKTYRYIAEFYYYEELPNQLSSFWRKHLNQKRLQDPHKYPEYHKTLYLNRKNGKFPETHMSNGLFNLPKAYVFPLRQKPFYYLTIPVLNKAEIYLDYVFGYNWRSRKRMSTSADYTFERGYHVNLMIPRDYRPL